MATAWQTFPIKFQGGLITNLGRLEQGTQAPGSATILQNFENSIEGGVKKIAGYDAFSDTEVTGAGPISGVISVAENKALAVREGIYYVSTGTTWTLVETAPNPLFDRIRFDRFNFDGTEKVVIVDGLNDPGYYNPADDSFTYDTSAPTDVEGASYVALFKNHIFFGKGNLLTFTAPYDELSYLTGDGAGVINVGSDITGLIVFREQLIIFSVDRIQRLAGNTLSDFVLQPITMNTGCLSGDTAQEVGGDILYLGPDGIRFLSATEKNEDFALELASSKIQPNISRMIRNNHRYSSTVIRGKSQYRIFTYSESLPRNLSGGFTATKFSDQSVDNISWSTIKGMKVYSVDSKQYGDNEVILFGSNDGLVYRMETGASFNGENINAIFETPYFVYTDPRIRKTIYKHSLYAKLGGAFNLECNIRLDYKAPGTIQPPSFYLMNSAGVADVYGSSTAIYGTTVYGSNIHNTYTNPVVGSGFTMALRYQDNSTNPSFALDYAVLEFTENERR